MNKQPQKNKKNKKFRRKVTTFDGRLALGVYPLKLRKLLTYTHLQKMQYYNYNRAN